VKFPSLYIQTGPGTWGMRLQTKRYFWLFHGFKYRAQRGELSFNTSPKKRNINYSSSEDVAYEKGDVRREGGKSRRRLSPQGSCTRERGERDEERNLPNRVGEKMFFRRSPLRSRRETGKEEERFNMGFNQAHQEHTTEQ